MMKILSMAVNDEWIAKLDEIIDNLEYKISWVVNESRLFEQLQVAVQTIVFLPYTKSFDMYSLCAKISKTFPLATPLLVFHSEEEVDMKKALRAGASDVIFLSSSISKIVEDIEHAIEKSGSKSFQQQQSNETKNGRVITVASTKGGVGKTTVAVNLAVAYGKKSAKVAVIDLDLQFGDVAMFFDVQPKRTIYDWVKENKEGKQIESYMTPFKDGISVLAAPQRPEFAEFITGDDVRKVIDKLKKQFDVVIIDVSSHMNENVLVALENSDDILILTYLDLPTLKNSKMLIDTLASLQLDERVRVVLNRQMKIKGITTDTVEKVVGKKIFSALPIMEKAMVTAVNEGQPLGYSNPRSKVAKKIFQIAETLNDQNRASAVKKKIPEQMASARGHV